MVKTRILSSIRDVLLHLVNKQYPSPQEGSIYPEKTPSFARERKKARAVVL
jgi:hypothetical protein